MSRSTKINVALIAITALIFACLVVFRTGPHERIPPWGIR